MKQEEKIKFDEPELEEKYQKFQKVLNKKEIKDKVLKELAPIIFRVKDGTVPLKEAVKMLKEEGYDDAIDLTIQETAKQIFFEIGTYYRNPPNWYKELKKKWC